MYFSQIWRSFDLFSKQFIFFIGDDKSKATMFGGSISLCIIFTSVLYLYYLFNLYFTNSIDPKVITETSIDDQLQEIKFDDSIIMFEMMILGEPIHKLQARTRKKYLNIYVEHEQWFGDGTLKATKVNLIECKYQGYTDYLCIDPATAGPLRVYPAQTEFGDYAIHIEPCKDEPECATEQEIYDLVFQPPNFFIIAIKTQSYSQQKRGIQNSISKEQYFLDPNILLFSRVSFVMGYTKIKEGLFMESSSEFQTILDYKRLDNSLTQEKIVQRFGYGGFGYIQVFLNQQKVQVTIQKPMITEVLAQFMSVVNSLFVLGSIARLFAQADIINDVINILLKDYFKKTAVKLIKNDEKVNKRLKQNTQDEKEEKQNILELNKKINDTNFIKKPDRFFKTSFLDKVKVFIKKIFRTEFKNNQTTSYEFKIYEKILKESFQRINIYQLYSDLLKIKMAIKLLYSKDQYAALMYCGSELMIENKFMTNQLEDNKKEISQQQHQQIILHFNNQMEGLKIKQNECPNNLSANKQSNEIEMITKKECKQEEDQIEKQYEDLQSNKCKKINLESETSINNLPGLQSYDILSQKMSKKTNNQSKIQQTENLILEEGDQDGNLVKSCQEKQNQTETDLNVKGRVKDEKKLCLEGFDGIKLSSYSYTDANNLKGETFNEEIMKQENRLHHLLFEMDQIESNQEVREFQLTVFLERIRKGKELRTIDLNLFCNLLQNYHLPQYQQQDQ